jgi:hypothetical protein
VSGSVSGSESESATGGGSRSRPVGVRVSMGVGAGQRGWYSRDRRAQTHQENSSALHYTLTVIDTVPLASKRDLATFFRAAAF